jgi:hypothetical protein
VAEEDERERKKWKKKMKESKLWQKRMKEREKSGRRR